MRLKSPVGPTCPLGCPSPGARLPLLLAQLRGLPPKQTETKRHNTRLLRQHPSSALRAHQLRCSLPSSVPSPAVPADPGWHRRGPGRRSSPFLGGYALRGGPSPTAPWAPPCSPPRGNSRRRGLQAVGLTGFGLGAPLGLVPCGDRAQGTLHSRLTPTRS